MKQRCGAAGGRPWAVMVALAVAIALTLALPATAAGPPVRVPEAQDPLFQPDEIHANPVHLTLALLGGSSQPGVGPWLASATLFAGEHPRVNAWRLEGPLTNLHSRRTIGAAALTLAGFHSSPSAQALTALVTARAGDYLDCWTLIDTDRFRPLPKAWLGAVTDGRGIPTGGLEAEVYSNVLIRAHYTSAAAFRSAARHDVTYAHVFNDPDTYRGVVISIEGRLKRINAFPLTREAAEAGVNALYEGWVFIDQLGANPYCVVFTEWPEDLPRDLLGKGKIDEPVKVAFAGYFFKKFRYTANDARATRRDAPLLIGQVLTVREPAGSSARSPTPFARVLLVLFAGIIGALILGVVGLTVWFRRNDNRIRQRLLAARLPEFALPPPEAPPVAPPVAAPSRPTLDAVNRPRNPPRITFPRTSEHPGRERERPGESGEGGKRGKGDKPPEEDAGA